MLRDENRVFLFTEMMVFDVFRLMRRNAPDAPAVPHAPSADERFTETTTPYAFIVLGGVFALAVDACVAANPRTNTTTAIARVVRNTGPLPLGARNHDATTRVARAAALPQTSPSWK
jgi:hypothetical protein